MSYVKRKCWQSHSCTFWRGSRGILGRHQGRSVDEWCSSITHFQLGSDINLILYQVESGPCIVQRTGSSQLQVLMTSSKSHLKDEIKRWLQTWYAAEVKKQLTDDIPMEQVKMEMTEVMHELSDLIYNNPNAWNQWTVVSTWCVSANYNSIVLCIYYIPWAIDSVYNDDFLILL